MPYTLPPPPLPNGPLPRGTGAWWDSRNQPQPNMAGRGLSQQQLEAAQAMILGTHDRLDTAPRMQESTTVADFYKGILPPSSKGPNDWGTAVGRTFDPIWENNDPGTIMTAAAMPQIPGPSGYSNLSKSQDRLSQGTGLAFAGDTSQPPGLAAITGATTPLPQMQPGMFGRGQPSMQWDPAVSTGPAPAGDPWGGMRIGDQSPPPMPGMSTGTPAEITVRGGSRSAPAPLPRPAFTNPSATYFDRSTGSFVTGRQPPPLPKRPSAEIHARLMAQQSPRASREQRIADAFRTDGVVAHNYSSTDELLAANERSRLKAQQNGGNQSPKPAGYGSKGYSEAGRALQALYGN